MVARISLRCGFPNWNPMGKSRSFKDYNLMELLLYTSVYSSKA